jgi:hypothetical protein
MLIKTITDNENGRKWEIFKKFNNNYFYKYYEFFNQIGWRLTGIEENYTRDSIEFEFDVSLA